MSASTDSPDNPLQQPSRRDPKSNAATGASAAGVRALGSQLVAFYFRAPVKAFFRTRVDYLAFARAINPRVQANESWSWRLSTPGLLTHAVKTHGWLFLPNQVLPPMLANISVGAVLYTSYLQILGKLHEPSSQSSRRVYPPPSPQKTFAAGFAAGAIQSVIAAPLDALQVRFRTTDITKGRYKNMWHYGYKKLGEIGMRRVFAGLGLSFVKDSLGYGAFFATFEYVKAQSYYNFVIMYYGHWRESGRDPILRPRMDESYSDFVIKPHYAIEPTFLMLAGIGAALTQQLIQHPITLIQSVYSQSLAVLDQQMQREHSPSNILRNYFSSYRRTYQNCLTYVQRYGGWRKWLFRGFFWNSIKQVPSTSAGLIIFELVRRRYGSADDAAVIEKDGAVILLA